jgi:hypothetical protein
VDVGLARWRLVWFMCGQRIHKEQFKERDDYAMVSGCWMGVGVGGCICGDAMVFTGV